MPLYNSSLTIRWHMDPCCPAKCMHSFPLWQTISKSMIIKKCFLAACCVKQDYWASAGCAVMQSSNTEVSFCLLIVCTLDMWLCNERVMQSHNQRNDNLYIHESILMGIFTCIWGNEVIDLLISKTGSILRFKIALIDTYRHISWSATISNNLCYPFHKIISNKDNMTLQCWESSGNDATYSFRILTLSLKLWFKPFRFLILVTLSSSVMHCNLVILVNPSNIRISSLYMTAK